MYLLFLSEATMDYVVTTTTTKIFVAIKLGQIKLTEVSSTKKV